MDRLLYVSMTGAKHNELATALNANNLANANTTGFKADFAQARSMQVYGDSLPSRVYAMTERPGTDHSPGPLQETGRNLDVAVKGSGFLTVLGPDGNEAYTRDGELTVDVDGTLRTTTGMMVLGDGGPVVLPPFERLQIGDDGTISIQGQGQGAEALTQVNRIKLVDPAIEDVEKGKDGLFRRTDGLIEPLAADASVVSGFLEGSNVNPVTAMTEILSLSRQFELQVKMMKTADDNGAASARLLQMN